MFKHGINGLFIGFILSFFHLIPTHSQTERISTQELSALAGKHFAESNFADAYESYRVLLERYPRDAQFNYFTGICLYRMNKDLPWAIECLEFASSKSDAPADALFFLGKAYQKNYQFSDAKSAFQKFESIAEKNLVQAWNPGLEAMHSGNAMHQTLVYNPFEIKSTSSFSLADTNYVTQVRGKGGILSIKPDELYAKNEETGGLTGLLFLPKNIQRGEYVYYSGYSRSKKKGSELFRIKRNGQSWGKPEELKSLNTDQDEVLPYFDPVGSDLYFASRGHFSMGGFDIFKSHYDPEKNTWSDPVNLGFPLNSPDNEFIAMPGSDLGSFFLITDRQGIDSFLTVYSIVLKEPKKSLANADNEELKMIGNFGGIAPIPPLVELKNDMDIISPSGQTNKEQKHPGEKIAETVVESRVSPEISAGLEFQKKSDSLAILAKETRIRVQTINDPDERWALQRKIIEWEKESKDLMEKASQAFFDGSLPLENQKSEISDAIVKDREVDGITIYRYREEQETSEPPVKDKKEEKETPAKNVTAIVQQAFNVKDEPGDAPKIYPTQSIEEDNRFSVLNKSPYNHQNPFPLDILIPRGPFYRIQLGVFSHDVDFNLFGGLFPITAESVPGKNMTRFYAGKFNRYEEARQALETVKQNGYKDAFIVSWYNGEKTALNKVIDLEKRDQNQSVK